MLLQKNTTTPLKDFGLNSYESKLWTALLSRGAATAGELSDIANVPRSRSYDVLESLEKKGFLIMKIGKPIKYIAVEPEHVLERVRKKIMEDAETQSNIIKQLEGSELLNDLKLLHRSGIKKVEPSDFSGVFKGKKTVYSNVEKKIKNARKQVLIQTTESGLVRDRDNLKNQLKKAKENGVKIMIAAPVTNQNRTAAKELSKFAEIRSTATAGRFYIVDGEEIIFMVTGDEEARQAYDSAIWVNSPFFTSALKKMFTTTWSSLAKAQLDQ